MAYYINSYMGLLFSGPSPEETCYKNTILIVNNFLSHNFGLFLVFHRYGLSFELGPKMEVTCQQWFWSRLGFIINFYSWPFHYTKFDVITFNFHTYPCRLFMFEALSETLLTLNILLCFYPWTYWSQSLKKSHEKI